jgi:hypothetical protein
MNFHCRVATHLVPILVLASVAHAFETGKYTKQDASGLDQCQLVIAQNANDLTVNGFTLSGPSRFSLSNKRPAFVQNYNFSIDENSSERLIVTQSYTQRRGGALCEYCQPTEVFSTFKIAQNQQGLFDFSLIQLRNGKQFVQTCFGMKKEN